MKPISRKLSLKRETLVRLDAETLAGVHGGTSPTFSIAVRLTPASIEHCLRVSLATPGVVGVATKAFQNAPKGNPNNPPSVVTATA